MTVIRVYCCYEDNNWKIGHEEIKAFPFLRRNKCFYFDVNDPEGFILTNHLYDEIYSPYGHTMFFYKTENTGKLIDKFIDFCKKEKHKNDYRNFWKNG